VPLTAEDARVRVDKLHVKLSARRAGVALAEDYYRGKQRLRFASASWADYNADRYRDFSDNWCMVVANSPSERLRVDGFRLDEDPAVSDTEKALWRDWLANDMESQASQGFLHSIIARRSYVLVWGDDDDAPVATWERADQMIVEYDVERPRTRVAALKTWCDDTTEFATLYTPDQVWKFQRPLTADTQRQVHRRPGRAGYEFFEGDTNDPGLTSVSGGGPSQWVARAGTDAEIPNPLGVVPVVEFPNRPMLGADPLSDIAGTMAMQDAINLIWAYLFNAADAASMPARVVLGQEPPKIPVLDESGNKVGERLVDIKKLTEQRIMFFSQPNTKIDSWDAARLDVFTGVIETAVAHVAAQTRTPPHYLILGKGMVNISADGMKAAEAGLVAKVSQEQVFFGPAVREVFRLFALVRNQKAVAEQARYGVVQWKDAENHSEAQRVDALQKLGALTFPFQWLAERYGLSQTEIQRVLEMRDSEAKKAPATVLANALTNQGGAVNDSADDE